MNSKPKPKPRAAATTKIILSIRTTVCSVKTRSETVHAAFALFWHKCERSKCAAAVQMFSRFCCCHCVCHCFEPGFCTKSTHPPLQEQHRLPVAKTCFLDYFIVSKQFDWFLGFLLVFDFLWGFFVACFRLPLLFSLAGIKNLNNRN